MAQILLIEDDRDNREVTELILTDAGHQVTGVRDGLQGLHRAVRDQPDLIVMDLGLPHLDGWKATICLKAHPVTRDIPVIACTAYVGEDALPRARAAGCAAVIAKPFEIDSFLTQIATILAQQPPHGRARVAGGR